MNDATVAVGVQAAINAYAQALDAGRTEDIVELFCADGVAEIPGSDPFVGRDGLRAGYAGFVPKRPQLHLMANTVITAWTEHEATATSDVAVFGRSSAGWAVQVVGSYVDTLHHHDASGGGQWRFHRRVLTLIP